MKRRRRGKQGDERIRAPDGGTSVQKVAPPNLKVQKQDDDATSTSFPCPGH